MMNSLFDDTTRDGRWIVGQPASEQDPFYTVMTPAGRIIAMRILNKEIAVEIAMLPIYRAAAREAQDEDSI